MERWKQITGFRNYEVSDTGLVRRRLKSNVYKVLRACNNGNGYMRVNLYKNGTPKKQYVHRLVAKEFLRNSKRLPEVHHINHDKTDNTLANLKWVSSEENNKHKVVFYRNRLRSYN